MSIRQTAIRRQEFPRGPRMRCNTDQRCWQSAFAPQERSATGVQRNDRKCGGGSCGIDHFCAHCARIVGAIWACKCPIRPDDLWSFLGRDGCSHFSSLELHLDPLLHWAGASYLIQAPCASTSSKGKPAESPKEALGGLETQVDHAAPRGMLVCLKKLKNLLNRLNAPHHHRRNPFFGVQNTTHSCRAWRRPSSIAALWEMEASQPARAEPTRIRRS
eukprot:s534_g35.t1